MTILYFAWLKERIGFSEETVEPPEHILTVADLVAWLAERSAGHTEAFKDLKLVRAAVDQTHVSFDTPITDAREVAFFPPVTGG